MKSFLSLMGVLVMILVVPTVITSCTKALAQTDSTTVQADDTTVQADSTAVAFDSGNLLTQIFSSADAFSWQNILVIVLVILSTVFATLWKRARNAITAIDEALSDGKIDKAELTKIIAAWKG